MADLTGREREQLDRFDQHWRVVLAGDDITEFGLRRYHGRLMKFAAVSIGGLHRAFAGSSDGAVVASGRIVPDNGLAYAGGGRLGESLIASEPIALRC